MIWEQTAAAAVPFFNVVGKAYSCTYGSLIQREVKIIYSEIRNKQSLSTNKEYCIYLWNEQVK
ncbi:hypothetical protein SAMN05518848_107281 [Paenibacillus sp. PDC88]|nr:hypothetical protein SAMN05518848_107281 [Paenibacillus sp. PDC88]